MRQFTCRPKLSAIICSLLIPAARRAGNLKVQEVGNGTTAAALGLAGINVAGPSASGSDILTLFSGLPTGSLNDGLGVRFDPVLPDAKITLADGTAVNVTLHKQSVVGTFASGTTDAANGVNAEVQFTAKQAGSASAGVTATFVDDPSITAGSEQVTYNAQAKTLVFKIQQGKTTANDIVAALSRDPTASAAFSAQHSAQAATARGSSTVADVALTAGPQSTATTPGTLGTNSKITFTAKSGGPSFDNVQISFVNNPAHHRRPRNGSIRRQRSAASEARIPDRPRAIDRQRHHHGSQQRPHGKSAFHRRRRRPAAMAPGIVSSSDTAITSGGAIIEPVPPGATTTLGDVLAALNAAAPGKLQAQIAPDGQGIKLTDLTSRRRHILDHRSEQLPGRRGPRARLPRLRVAS